MSWTNVICSVKSPPSWFSCIFHPVLITGSLVPHISYKFAVIWRGLIRFIFRFSLFDMNTSEVILHTSVASCQEEHNIWQSHFPLLNNGLSLIYPIMKFPSPFHLMVLAPGSELVKSKLVQQANVNLVSPFLPLHMNGSCSLCFPMLLHRSQCAPPPVFYSSPAELAQPTLNSISNKV